MVRRRSSRRHWWTAPPKQTPIHPGVDHHYYRRQPVLLFQLLTQSLQLGDQPNEVVALTRAKFHQSLPGDDTLRRLARVLLPRAHLQLPPLRTPPKVLSLVLLLLSCFSVVAS